MKNKTNSPLSFRKESLTELNTESLNAINSGVGTTTAGTTSNVIEEITRLIRQTTVTFN